MAQFGGLGAPSFRDLDEDVPLTMPEGTHDIPVPSDGPPPAKVRGGPEAQIKAGAAAKRAREHEPDRTVEHGGTMIHESQLDLAYRNTATDTSAIAAALEKIAADYGLPPPSAADVGQVDEDNRTYNPVDTRQATEEPHANVNHSLWYDGSPSVPGFLACSAPWMYDPMAAPETALKAYVPAWRSQAAGSNVLDYFLASSKHHRSARRYTHVCYNSGSYKVPPAGAHALLTSYAYAIAGGARAYVVERPSPVLRLFFDFDFFQPRGLTKGEVEALAFMVHSVVVTFYADREKIRKAEARSVADAAAAAEAEVHADRGSTPEARAAATRARETAEALHDAVCDDRAEFLRSMVTMAPYARDGDLVKTGVHIHYPRVVATPSRAQAILQAVRAHLAKNCGHRAPPFNPWEKVVDASVYGDGEDKDGAGLRFIGSRRVKPCDGICGGSSYSSLRRAAEAQGMASVPQRCPKCRGHGKLDAGRAHFPVFCCDGATGRRDTALEIAFRKQGIKAAILAGSIRTNLAPDEIPEDGFRAPPGFEVAPLPKMKRAKGVDGAAGAGGAGATKRKVNSDERNTRPVETSDETLQALRAFLAKFHGGDYAAADIAKVEKKRSKEEGCEVVFVKFHGDAVSRQCPWHVGPHRSQTVYLVIPKNGDGAFLKCFDDDCKANKSRPERLPDTLFATFFPDAQQRVGRVTADMEAAMAADLGAMDRNLEKIEEPDGGIDSLQDVETIVGVYMTPDLVAMLVDLDAALGDQAAPHGRAAKPSLESKLCTAALTRKLARHDDNARAVLLSVLDKISTQLHGSRYSPTVVGFLQVSSAVADKVNAVVIAESVERAAQARLSALGGGLGARSHKLLVELGFQETSVKEAMARVEEDVARAAGLAAVEVTPQALEMMQKDLRRKYVVFCRTMAFLAARKDPNGVAVHMLRRGACPADVRRVKADADEDFDPADLLPMRDIFDEVDDLDAEAPLPEDRPSPSAQLLRDLLNLALKPLAQLDQDEASARLAAAQADALVLAGEMDLSAADELTPAAAHIGGMLPLTPAGIDTVVCRSIARACRALNGHKLDATKLAVRMRGRGLTVSKILDRVTFDANRLIDAALLTIRHMHSESQVLASECARFDALADGMSAWRAVSRELCEAVATGLPQDGEFPDDAAREAAADDAVRRLTVHTLMKQAQLLAPVELYGDALEEFVRRHIDDNAAVVAAYVLGARSARKYDRRAATKNCRGGVKSIPVREHHSEPLYYEDGGRMQFVVDVAEFRRLTQPTASALKAAAAARDDAEAFNEHVDLVGRLAHVPVPAQEEEDGCTAVAPRKRRVVQVNEEPIAAPSPPELVTPYPAAKRMRETGRASVGRHAAATGERRGRIQDPTNEDTPHPAPLVPAPVLQEADW